MGISFSAPSCDLCIDKISQWLAEKVGYTHKLKKNLTDLKKIMDDLKAKRDDLSRDRALQRLSEFKLWLTRVETIEKEVNNLLDDRDAELQKMCLCGFCSKNLISSYRYGKKVFLKISEVEELKTKLFDKIADQTSEAQDRPLQPIKEDEMLKSEVLEVIDEQAQSSEVEERQLQPIKKVEKLKSKVLEVIVEQALTPEVEERQLQPIIVGQETMLNKAWKHLMEDGVGIMGIYGMGGVGKTTLLSQINNKFMNDTSGFDFVIWVVVSKQLHVEDILDEVSQKVGLGGQVLNQKDKSQKAHRLYNFLKRKRFVLFLDDIWEKVDLKEIGVPDPRTKEGCIVAFTTRSQDVCSRMGVEDPMEIQCLADNEAFDLFEKKVGQLTLRSDPGIPDLARIVAKECCGLPLALNIIGETMSGKKTIQEWQHAIDVLKKYAAEFSGMEKILMLLKYSYDSLEGDHVKSCLLYCALFPEDDKILKEKLIEYWIGEGIIDGSEGIEMAENKGYHIIGSLVRASLLIYGVSEGQACVYMHDVVREMALWIASDLGIQKEAFIVRVGLDEIPKVKNWNAVRRMSLMKNKIHHLAGSLECLELTTLLLQDGEFKNISSEFFKFMPKLAVLDISVNHSLFELPEGISHLVSLQYLNLFATNITHLPKGLQELRKLIHLDLESTYYLKSIAGMSSLHNLKVLKLAHSGFAWDLETVEELEALEHLEVLTTTIDNRSPGAKHYLSSDRLMSCTQSLQISKRQLESSGISLLDKLRKFSISYCSISEIKMRRICFLSLSEVHISVCTGLKELTFLMFAPNLSILIVIIAEDLEDIINKEKAYEVENSGILPFRKLSKLTLSCLWELKNIYWSPLPFPCLQTITIRNCPNLKKLPLDSRSGKHGDNGLIIIYKEKEWLKGVEWEDEATRTHFLPSCKFGQ